MFRAFTGTAVRAAEKPLLDAGHGDHLMRLAAWGLHTHILRFLRTHQHTISGTRITGLIGPGNNGGDALWALSFLAARGMHITAVPVATDADSLHPEGLAAFRAAGGRITDTVDPNTAVILDGVWGTGFRGHFDFPAVLAEAGIEIPENARVIACDIPSGVVADTGQIPGRTLVADLTVTFGGPKLGLYINDGATVSGDIEVVDIGIGPHLEDQPGWWMPEPKDLATTFAPAPRDAHKYSAGVFGVVAGSPQYPGAAVLVTQAALASGVGMVELIAPADREADESEEKTVDGVADMVLAAHPEIVVRQTSDPRASGWVIGPGLGTDERAQGLLNQLVEHVQDHPAPVVIDASALDLLSAPLLDRLTSVCPQVVLTPHDGEFSRLLDRLAPDLADTTETEKTEPSSSQARRLSLATAFAQRFNLTLVLKGADTIVAGPRGFTGINPSLGSQLATAGTGDTLAGILGVIAARHHLLTDAHPEMPFEAHLLTGVFAHAKAGVESLKSGPVSAAGLADGLRRTLSNELTTAP